jgi:hypothetical protein
MMTNYLTWSDAGFDSGLCVRWPGTAGFNAARPRAEYERPALARWANFGTTTPR